MKPRSSPFRILLCVTGSVAAYKAAELARRLSRWAEVRVMLTPAAARLVNPDDFRKSAGIIPLTDLFAGVKPLSTATPAGSHPRIRVPHIDFARDCDLVLVAPATADFIAKLAHGLADDLPSTACLYSNAPLWVAPAMNVQMWRHPAVKANAGILQTRGAVLLGPSSGVLACGDEGEGRMWEPGEIARRVEEWAARRRPKETLAWKGLAVLVTAGPTREALDPVRFISNRSSGRMGYALAGEAARRGASVTLVTGPVSLEPPSGVSVIRVETAVQMRRAVLARSRGAGLILMAAAVADWRPGRSSPRKIKKSSGAPSMTLVPNPDILADVIRRRVSGQVVVGFAAETDRLDKNARAKLARKPCDVLAANVVGRGRGMETDDNALKLYGRKWKGSVDLGKGTKAALSVKLLDFIQKRFRLVP